MSDTKAPEKSQKKETTVATASTSGYVGWGDVGVKKSGDQKKDSDKKSLPYLKLEEGKPYKIRLVGKPYKFYSHFNIIRAISPGFDEDVCWQAGNAPRERYAILVLDRNDENLLKILEAGPAVFNEFKAYFELCGKDPGAKDGPDWFIQVKIPTVKKDGRSFKDKRSTQYQVMRDESAPFTEKEIEYMAKETGKDLEIVKKLKAPTSPDLIKEMFEDAKVRGEKDPIPGSTEWWKARREKKQNASGSDDAPIVPPDGKDEEVSVPKEEGEAKAGFGGLFDEEDDSSKDSVAF